MSTQRAHCLSLHTLACVAMLVGLLGAASPAQPVLLGTPRRCPTHAIVLPWRPRRRSSGGKTPPWSYTSRTGRGSRRMAYP